MWPRDFKSDTLALSMNATRFLPITSSMLRLKSDHVANSRAPDNIAETTAAAQTTPVFHQHDGVDHRLQQRSVWIRGALVGAPARSRCRQRSANLPACIAASKSVDAQSSSLVLTGQALHNSAFRTPNRRYCQYLWMGEFQATSDPVLAGSAGGVSGVMLVGRSSSLPVWNTAPARTSATRCGALTARQRAWAASISL